MGAHTAGVSLALLVLGLDLQSAKTCTCCKLLTKDTPIQAHLSALPATS